MSELDRGAYAPPTEASLSFDPRQPVRGARPIPFTLIISILVLVGLAAAIFVFYRSGVRQAGQPPQAVGAPVGGMKAPPPVEAQPQDPAAGLQIYQSENGAPATPSKGVQFAPPPEQPQARPQAGSPPPAIWVQPAAPASAAPPLRPTIAAEPAGAAHPTAPIAATQIAKAAPPPAAGAAAPPPAPKIEKPAAKAPAPAPAPAKPAATRPEPAKAVAAKPAAAKPEPAAKAGVASVQIGAFSSQTLADKGWSDAAATAPGAAAGKGKSVEKVEKDGHTYFRTQVTGFGSRAEASAFCAKLKTAGKACFVK
jgi:hypothetical protein